MAKEPDSKALVEARTELQAIGGELLTIKVRLLKTGKRLRAAESMAAVVDVHPDGHTLTVENWTGELIGETVREQIDKLLDSVGRAADFETIRADIHEHVENDREIEARRPKA
jgi:hypothetical protein